jgi:trehalose 2-sulfotransferase
MSAVADLRGYVICAYARSGSNRLCELLASTGVLGRPADYFNGHGFRARGHLDYPLEREAQFAQVLERGCTANGVYGLKMFASGFDRVARTRWNERLPKLRYLHLERRDLLGQAISDVRANQTLQFRSTAEVRRELHYDRDAIATSLIQFAQQHARLSLFFARNGIEPLRLTYENVVAQPQSQIDAIASWLGETGPARIDPARLQLEVQRDDVNRRWRERFLAESHDTRHLDRCPGPLRIELGRLLVRARSLLR